MSFFALYSFDMNIEKYILITGGAGYIGSNMVYFLLEKKENIVVYDNLSTGNIDFLPKDVVFIEGDLKDKNLLKNIFKKYNFESVIHFAAKSIVLESMEKPTLYFENNVYGLTNLLGVCKEFNVSNFIFSSTAAVYGNPEKQPIKEDFMLLPVNPYGWSKLLCEKLLYYESLNWLNSVSLRYFNAAGAHPELKTGEMHPVETHLVPNIFEALSNGCKLKIFGNDYPTKDGTCIRDYIHVWDLCEAHYLALQKLRNGFKYGVFNLGNGKGFSIMDVIKTVEKITGLKVDYEIAGRREGDPAVLIADYEKAKKELDWAPKRGLDEIIESAWKFYQKVRRK